MRKALNENPRVQLAVLGIGGVALAILMLTTFSGGGSSTPSATDPAATSSTGAPATSAATDPAAVDPAAATTPATPATSAPATTPPATGSVTPAPAATTPSTAPATDAGAAEGLLPSAGLPEDVLVAYAKNKALALLVIDPKAVSDKQVEKYTVALKSRNDVEVFVVKAKDIAEYARITQGVAVSRTPSLVVIRPRDKSSGVPTASVSEGFRSPESVRTALEDALYGGPDVPSYPE